MLRPRERLVAADGIENEGTRQFHVDDVYNPIDPETLGHRLARAGFDVDRGARLRPRLDLHRGGSVIGRVTRRREVLW